MNELKERRKRDGWDKAAVVASLLVPVSVALIGLLGTQFLHRQQKADNEFRVRQQAAETRGRLYVELQTSREKADSDLRKSMFDTVISTFLKDGSQNPPEMILALELLTYNFHEVIDLGPLFKHVEGIVGAITPEDQRSYYGYRLQRAAAQVIDKQLAALKDVSTIKEHDVFFDELEERPQGIQLFDGSGNGGNDTGGIIQLAKTDDIYTFAEAAVLGVDEINKELRVHLRTYHLKTSAIKNKEPQVRDTEIDIVFKVSFYDFPMIDNTRLANGRRIAIVLKQWEAGWAKVALVYFPGSRASLKEKPYYEELIENLTPHQMDTKG